MGDVSDSGGRTTDPIHSRRDNPGPSPRTDKTNLFEKFISTTAPIVRSILPHKISIEDLGYYYNNLITINMPYKSYNTFHELTNSLF